MLSRLYEIQKADYTFEQLQKLREQLHVQPTTINYATGEKQPGFDVYFEDEEKFYGPKFAMRKILGNEQDNAGEFTGVPISGDVKFVGTLKEDRFQPQAVAEVLKALAHEGGAILSLSCGLGKTVDAIAVFVFCGVKTLVIVHKVFLMNQWRERIQQFAPACKIGCIQAQNVDVEGADIVIATMQSLAMIDYSVNYPHLFDDFGMVIVDEAHRVCAQTMCRCLPKVACRHMLALSATPTRKDGLNSILEFYFNRIAFEAKRENESATVKIVHVLDGPRKERWIRGPKPRLNFSRMITELCRDQQRNQAICHLIKDALLEQRKVLVLSDRIEHLHTLHDMLQVELADVQMPRNDDEICGEEFVVPELANLFCLPTIDFYIGGRKEAQLKVAEKANCILGSFPFAQEGMDLSPPPDTLILASPKANIVQSVGRIMRESSMDNRCLIVDLMDSWSMFMGLATKRRAFYFERDYDQQHYDYRDGLLIPQKYEEEDIDAERAFIEMQTQKGNDVFADEIEFPF